MVSQKEYQLIKIYINDLDLDKSSKLFTDSSNGLATILNEFKEKDSFLLTQKQFFTDKIPIFKNALHREKGSKISQEIARANKERNQVFIGISHGVQAYKHSNIPAKKSASLLLLGILKNYKGITSASYEKASGEYNLLISQLRETDNHAAITTLNLQDLVDQLSTSQHTFDTLYLRRVTEKEQKIGQTAGQIREELWEKYDNMCKYIEMMANSYSDRPVFIKLFRHLNELRKPYKRSKTKSKKEEPKPEEVAENSKPEHED